MVFFESIMLLAPRTCQEHDALMAPRVEFTMRTRHFFVKNIMLLTPSRCQKQHDALVAPHGIHHEDKAFPDGFLVKSIMLLTPLLQWPRTEFTTRTGHFQMVFWQKSIMLLTPTKRQKHDALVAPNGTHHGFLFVESIMLLTPPACQEHDALMAPRGIQHEKKAFLCQKHHALDASPVPKA